MENKNLSLINIMSNNNNNNKFVNYVQTLANDRNKIVKKNRKLYDEATALYINRKISQKRSLELIINALILIDKKDVEKAKAKILKFNGSKPQIVIKKDIPLKNFHILVDVVIEIKYKEKEYKSGKKKKEVIEFENFAESKIIKAKTITTAKKFMEEEITKQYNYEESYYVVTVKSIKFNSILDVNDPIVKTDVKAMRMRQLGTDILDYDYV